MTRYHQMANGERRPYTDAEEAAANAEETAAALPAALAAFKAKRERVLAGGATSGGHTYDADRDGWGSLTSAVVLGQTVEAINGQGTFSATWKTRNGSHTVNLAQLIAAGLAVGTKVGAAYAREAALATTARGGDIPGAISAIDSGWPS